MTVSPFPNTLHLGQNLLLGGLFGLALLGCDGTTTGTDIDSGTDGVDAGVVTNADGGPTTDTDGGPTTDTDAGPITNTDAGWANGMPNYVGPAERLARLITPPAHDGSTALPLVIAMHGYTGNAAQLDGWLGLGDVARAEGFYLVLPDGTEDGGGSPFWNATDSCCDFYRSGTDDVAYLRGLIEEVQSLGQVDATRIYFMGHSNGGFMSYRMACEMSDVVAAIATLAGSDYLAEDGCTPSEPVSVLQIHGTADGTVDYEGGSFDPRIPPYPGAQAVIDRWAARAGCDAEGVMDATNIDLDRNLDGDETSVVRWQAGCDAGHEMQLWTIAEGSHTPAVSADFGERMIGFLLSQHR